MPRSSTLRDVSTSMESADESPDRAETAPPLPAGVVVAAPLAEQVFDTLRGWIVNGDLPPGYRLRVRDLAESVGTSVMPVREAIRRLVESGLAVHEPYKGASVRRLEVAELEQAYDARILLEGECARLGAEAASPEVVDQMEEHWSRLQVAAQAGDVSTALQADEDLLSEVYRAADNEVLCELISGLWDRCRAYKVVWATSADGAGGESIWHFKPDLIAAVRDNDGARAQEVLRTSYEVAKDTLRATLGGDDRA